MRRLLLCSPDFYGIEYEINPWMHRSQSADVENAQRQWRNLRDKLESLGSQIELVSPQSGLPDMVFTANAGLLVGDKFVPSNFRHKERQGEQKHFIDWFSTRNIAIERLPSELIFEGEGDALFCGDVLFCGYRFRSDIRSHQWLSEFFKCLTVSVELIDERFYHLDTCFCSLPDGGAIWFPPAFDEYAQRSIEKHTAYLIEVAPDEAVHFACNAVVLKNQIVLPEGCPKLCHDLQSRDYACHPLPMTEFIKAGGACKCLTLLLPAREK